MYPLKCYPQVFLNSREIGMRACTQAFGALGTHGSLSFAEYLLLATTTQVAANPAE